MLGYLIQQLIEREWKHHLDVHGPCKRLRKDLLQFESKQMLARIESVAFDPKTLTLREEGRQASN